MQLTPHFSLEEMTRTSQPFANDPSPTEVAKLRMLCARVLEPIRAHFGLPIKVNSGFRSAKVNAAVGSHPGSQHRLGEAADIEVPGISNDNLAKYIAGTIQFDQLILENHKKGIPTSGWVHVSYREGRLRRDVLTMTLGSHGPVYTHGLNI